MTPVALSSRMVARRRRLMLRSAIPLGLAAFAAVVTISVVSTVGAEISEMERREISGELSSSRRVDSDETGAGPPVTQAPNVLTSHAWIVPGVVISPERAEMAEIWFTDVSQELTFRGHGSGSVESSANDGGDGATSRMSTEPLQVSVPGLGLVSSPDIVTTSRPDRTIVLVPWQALPSADPPIAGHEYTRLRGVGPLNNSTARQLAAESGLQPTRWRHLARSRMRDLRLLGIAVVGMLFLAGGAAMAPSIGIAVRRFSSEFELLMTLGYKRRYITMLIVSTGAIVSGFAAAIGSLAAGVAMAIVSARGGLDSSVLPLYWLEGQPTLGAIAPGPPLLPVVLAVALAIASGALSSLPAARLPDTMGRHGRLWR